MLLVSTVLLMVPFSRAEPKMKETVKGCSGRVLEFNISSIKNKIESLHFNHNLENINIPNEFDSRRRWPLCQSIQRVQDQGKCGACWAFAATSVMTDRFCIAARGKFERHISTQDLLECCDSCIGPHVGHAGGCGDGYTIRAFEFWKENGIVTGNEACKPTDIETEEGVQKTSCRNICTNRYYVGQYSTAKTYASGFYLHVNASSQDLRQVQAEIMFNGPIVGAMDIYEFMYKIKRKTVLVYRPRLKNEERRAHAVKILGWDVKDDVPVWIIENSWGRRWCDSGFCYVRRGQNDFNIESYVMIAAMPRISHPVKIGAFTEVRVKSSDSETQLLNIFVSTLYVIFVKIFIIDLN